ncbi:MULTISPECIES: hypothetical protein [Thiorhodovibrio]|uniref:hypothetical protein n=1 Tax=Thiorhodovibrio TaxID=61593 RepID=UPI001F5CBFA8|nr:MULTISPECIES: hypothetical protein [Thiorhodovibrio]MBK5967527.1 hypothetical protein [Thiorhodovibrio winogradskyi]WPL14968.1 hypothetical protein Thiosp_04826 [Thiorhodovibrio litoralis]
MFSQANTKNCIKPSDWAEATWQPLKSQGQRLLKEGKPMESEEDNRAELRHQAEAFPAKQLPILKVLQVV